LQERPRCLVLPASIALADRTCQSIGAYLRAGGTVLADHSTALYDEQLVLRSRGGLDAEFGIRARSLRLDDLQVREGRLRAGPAGQPVAELGLRGEVAEPAGDEQVFVENRPGRGRAVYLNLAVCEYAQSRLDAQRTAVAQDLRRRVRQVLQSAGVVPTFDVRGQGLPTCLWRSRLVRAGRPAVLAVRVAALERPELLQQLAAEGPRKVQLSFPREVRLRTLAGEDLGRGTAFELLLDVYAGLFVEEVGS
jgi:hypothetical protein